MENELINSTQFLQVIFVCIYRLCCASKAKQIFLAKGYTEMVSLIHEKGPNDC